MERLVRVAADTPQPPLLLLLLLLPLRHVSNPLELKPTPEPQPNQIPPNKKLNEELQPANRGNHSQQNGNNRKDIIDAAVIFGYGADTPVAFVLPVRQKYLFAVALLLQQRCCRSF